ncbi:hypothetical protein JGU71_19725 [Antrihabitans sp. YC3-6]|uniref:Uncharacterized protein n=1 Tax=Antrihabitans stalagmiti TaxID=2799499 RepID=A0A934NTG7_9NOCA|nr:hypothetical protein [Antrihabitans stalagmiti]MBJ8341121.1 hypothetical protein [Antrihabitans stalagmiti]
MTVTEHQVQPRTSRQSSWTRRLNEVAAGSIGLIGVSHILVIHVFDGPKPADEQHIAELSAVATTSLAEGFGRELSVLGLNTGYSVGTGVFATTFAILVVLAGRSAPTIIGRTLFTFTCFVTACTLLVISILYFPEPVTVLAALGTVLFAAVLALDENRSAGEPAVKSR